MNAWKKWKSLLWKPYRTLRTFWLGLLGIILGMAVLVIILNSLGNAPPQNVLFLIPFGFLLSSTFALAVPITLFSTERDNGTFGFLRTLPISPRRLVESAAIVGIGGSFLMMLISWFLLGCLSGIFFSEWLPYMFWGGALLTLEFLAWGTLSSLRFDRPFKAAAMATVGMVLTNSAVVSLWRYWYGSPYYSNNIIRHLWLEVTGPRLVIAAVLVCLSWYLAEKWFRDRVKGDKKFPAKRTEGETAPEAVMEEEFPQPTAAKWKLLTWNRSERDPHGFTSMLWQTFRDAWPVWRWFGIVVIVFAFFGALVGLVEWYCVTLRTTFSTEGPDPILRIFDLHSGHPFRVFWGWVYSLFGIFCIVFPIVYGWLVFRADHRRKSFRFLSYHGVRPSTAWWSRQLVWGTGFLLLLGIMAATLHYGFLASLPRFNSSGSSPEKDAEWYLFLRGLGNFTLWPFLIYAFGQYTSLAIRSGMLGFLTAGMLTIGLAIGTLILILFTINPVWILPILAIGFFVSSRLQMGRMMTETRGRLRGMAVLLLPSLCAFAVVVGITEWLRCTEFPPVIHTYSQKYHNLLENERRSNSVHKLPPFDQWHQEQRESLFQTRRLTPQEREALDLYVDVVRGEKPTLEEALTLLRKADRMELAADKPNCPIAAQDLLPYYADLHELYFKIANGAEPFYRNMFDTNWETLLIALRLQKRFPLGDFTFHTHYLLNWYKNRDWLYHSDQTSEKLKKGIRDLEAFHWDQASVEPILIYQEMTRQLLQWKPEPPPFLDSGKDPSKDPCKDFYQRMRPFYHFFGTVFPWEKIRCHNALDYYATAQMAQWQGYNAELKRTAKGKKPGCWKTPGFPKLLDRYLFPIPPAHIDNPLRLASLRNYPLYNPGGFLEGKTIRTPLFMHVFYSSTNFRIGEEAGYWDCALHRTVQNEQTLRLLQVAMAVRAWQLDHEGQAPKELSQLVGEYLEYVPFDPMTGEPFEYYPEGIDFDKLNPHRTRSVLDRKRNPSHVPTLVAYPLDETKVTVNGELCYKKMKNTDDSTPEYWSFWIHSDCSSWNKLRYSRPVNIETLEGLRGHVGHLPSFFLAPMSDEDEEESEPEKTAKADDSPGSSDAVKKSAAGKDASKVDKSPKSSEAKPGPEPDEEKSSEEPAVTEKKPADLKKKTDSSPEKDASDKSTKEETSKESSPKKDSTGKNSDNDSAEATSKEKKSDTNSAEEGSPENSTDKKSGETADSDSEKESGKANSEPSDTGDASEKKDDAKKKNKDVGSSGESSSEGSEKKADQKNDASSD